MKAKANLYHLSSDSAKGKKFGIVRSVWNDTITKRLYDGCYTTLIKHGAIKNHIKTLEVPGSFELIYGGKRMAEQSDIDSIIVIGSIIKGETPHFDFISQSVANGIKDLNILFDIPFIFCVLTDLNENQAINRSGGKIGNKGTDAALAAITLINNSIY
tara:strand:- start:594 stop:1067 length:474 start_codon:yes stop_codon:yes gene_type:complete